MSILIQNGTIVDGTGTERYKADVLIDGDRIGAIGHIAPSEGMS